MLAQRDARPCDLMQRDVQLVPKPARPVCCRARRRDLAESKIPPWVRVRVLGKVPDPVQISVNHRLDVDRSPLHLRIVSTTGRFSASAPPGPALIGQRHRASQLGWGQPLLGRSGHLIKTSSCRTVVLWNASCPNSGEDTSDIRTDVRAADGGSRRADSTPGRRLLELDPQG